MTAVGDQTAGTTPDGTHGYSKQKEQHLKRLRRIEGQIRGLQRMVEEDVYCIDILTQVSAGTKALQSFALQLLEEHLRHCVATAVIEGSGQSALESGLKANATSDNKADDKAGDKADDKVAEATAAIARLLRA
ncbi:MAG: metal-sensitive transcriptional regulator [Streptomycetaceae bacterium]|nr:metal-sensitive transcriptional regulator [Streptomycetaceae bacterium]